MFFPQQRYIETQLISLDCGVLLVTLYGIFTNITYFEFPPKYDINQSNRYYIACIAKEL